MNVVVRKYQDTDLEKVNEVLEEAFEAKKDNFTSNNHTEVVLCCDDVVCGYSLLTRIFNPIRKFYYIHVDYVCILSKYRGLGLGRELMDYIEGIAKEQSARYLELSCSRFRIPSHKLYEECGYIKRDSDIYRKGLV